MKYNKLVRDGIPVLIELDGKTCQWHRADSKEYTERLFEKMCEELIEFHDDPCVEEAADIYEVFAAMLKTCNIPWTEVINRALNKREERGGFSEGIILTEVSDENTI